MKVFVAGASGAIGTRLVPQLLEQGHEVIGTSTSPASAARVRALGAYALVLDVLDRGAVRRAVVETRPDAIVHQATALSGVQFSKELDRSFVQTNRLRKEGTDALLEVARRPRGTERLAAGSRTRRAARTLLETVRRAGPIAARTAVARGSPALVAAGARAVGLEALGPETLGLEAVGFGFAEPRPGRLAPCRLAARALVVMRPAACAGPPATRIGTLAECLAGPLAGALPRALGCRPPRAATAGAGSR